MMILAITLLQIAKLAIGCLILALFTFLIFATILVFKGHDFKNVFTKIQKQQLDCIVKTYYLIYIFDTKLDEKSRDKINDDVIQMQNYLMEMARIIGGQDGEVYVQTQMEIMCKNKQVNNTATSNLSNLTSSPKAIIS